MDIINIIGELYEFYFFEDIFSLQNIDFNILNKLNREQNIALYYNINGKERQSIVKINDLKNRFLFVKINYRQNFINYIINKDNYNYNKLLFKINNMIWLRPGIKFHLNINEFPLTNYFLEETNIHFNEAIFDKIYILKHMNEKNINLNNYINNLNNINNNFSNSFNSNNNFNNKQFIQEERIKELEKLLKVEKDNNKNLYERINKLETSLNEKINQNEDLKKKLKNLEDTLNQKTNELINKTNELNQMNKINLNQNQLNEIINKNNSEIENLKSKIKRYPFELLPGEEIMSIIIWSNDQNVHCSFICKNSDLFVNIELKIYEKYPQYREHENFFTFKGIKINKYKNLKENDIKNSDIIILNPII